MNRDASAISKAPPERFGEDIAVPPELPRHAFAALVTRGGARRFDARPVEAFGAFVRARGCRFD